MLLVERLVEVSAFYDSNNHLNIIGGGSLKASAITLVYIVVTGIRQQLVVLESLILRSLPQNLQANQLTLQQIMVVLMSILMAQQ